jgi:hypothetical protein
MKKFPIIAALAVLAAGFCSGHAEAATHRADCLLVAGGKTYINGPCDFTADAHGFSIDQGTAWAAVSTVDDPVDGSWGAGRAADDLGPLHTAGACWENDWNKVCAWKPGERRWFADAPALAQIPVLASAEATTSLSATAGEAVNISLLCRAPGDSISVAYSRPGPLASAAGGWLAVHHLNGRIYDRAAQYSLIDASGDAHVEWVGRNDKHPDVTMIGEIRTNAAGDYIYVETLSRQGETFQTDVMPCQDLGPDGPVAPAPALAAVDTSDPDRPAPLTVGKAHNLFVYFGQEMQMSVECHTGGPIHLDDYPMDSDVQNFRDAHRDLTHQWAMEGIRLQAQQHILACSNS